MTKEETLSAITFVMQLLDAENLQIPAVQSLNYIRARSWIEAEHNSVKELPDEDTVNDPLALVHDGDSTPAG